MLRILLHSLANPSVNALLCLARLAINNPLDVFIFSCPCFIIIQMVLFITTVFIAELIIAGALLNFIIKADRQVLAANQAIVDFRPTLETGLREAYNIVRNLKQTLHYIFCLIERKKKQYIFKIVSAVCLYCVLFFWKGKYRKIAAFLQLAMLLNGFVEKFAACKKT